jgi:hypothetical protein
MKHLVKRQQWTLATQHVVTKVQCKLIPLLEEVLRVIAVS